MNVIRAGGRVAQNAVRRGGCWRCVWRRAHVLRCCIEQQRLFAGGRFLPRTYAETTAVRQTAHDNVCVITADIFCWRCAAYATRVPWCFTMLYRIQRDI